jgi:hypothetical protein
VSPSSSLSSPRLSPSPVPMFDCSTNSSSASSFPSPVVNVSDFPPSPSPPSTSPHSVIDQNGSSVVKPSPSHLPPEDSPLDDSYGLDTLFDTHDDPFSEGSPSSLPEDSPCALQSISEDPPLDDPYEFYDVLDYYYDSVADDQDPLIPPNESPNESPLVEQRRASMIGTPVRCPFPESPSTSFSSLPLSRLSLSPSPLFVCPSNSSSVLCPLPFANVSKVSRPSSRHNILDRNDFDVSESSPIRLPPEDPPPDNLHGFDEISDDYHNPSIDDHDSLDVVRRIPSLWSRQPVRRRLLQPSRRRRLASVNKRFSLCVSAT